MLNARDPCPLRTAVRYMFAGQVVYDLGDWLDFPSLVPSRDPGVGPSLWQRGRSGSPAVLIIARSPECGWIACAKTVMIAADLGRAWRTRAVWAPDMIRCLSSNSEDVAEHIFGPDARPTYAATDEVAARDRAESVVGPGDDSTWEAHRRLSFTAGPRAAFG